MLPETTFQKAEDVPVEVLDVGALVELDVGVEPLEDVPVDVLDVGALVELDVAVEALVDGTDAQTLKPE